MHTNGIVRQTAAAATREERGTGEGHGRDMSVSQVRRKASVAPVVKTAEQCLL